MDRLLRFFVERHLLVNVAAVAFVVLGYLSAVSLQRGGVGFYEKSDFVHVDTGPVRTW